MRNYTFQIMMRTVTIINTLISYYRGDTVCNKGNYKPPKMVVAATNHTIRRCPDISTDGNDVDIDRSYIITINNDLKVYICTASNINDIIVDKIIAHPDTNDGGMNVSPIIIIPVGVFEEYEIPKSIHLLRSMFFELARMDSELTFDPDPAIISYFNSANVAVPVYDAEIAITAICCTYFSLKKAFDDNSQDREYYLNTVINDFTDSELTADAKEIVKNILIKYDNTSNMYNDIGNGRIISLLSGE